MSLSLRTRCPPRQTPRLLPATHSEPVGCEDRIFTPAIYSMGIGEMENMLLQVRRYSAMDSSVIQLPDAELAECTKARKSP